MTVAGDRVHDRSFTHRRDCARRQFSPASIARDPHRDISIAIHNISEGVAVSLALVPFGETARNAAAWSIFSSLPNR